MRGETWLFIVAVGTYQDPAMPPLPGAITDANRLRETLTEHANARRFAWLLDGNAPKRTILKELQRVAAKVGENDRVVMSFHLHAHRRRDHTGKRWEYFLLPYDATPERADACGISTVELGQALRRVKVRELVLILDCCHASGLVDVSWLNDVKDDLQDGFYSQLILASARAQDVAEDEGQGTYFMTELCETLSGRRIPPDEDGYIYAQEAGCYAERQANAEARRRNRRQVAVMASFGPPIALTQVRLEGGPDALGRYVRSYPSSQDRHFLEELSYLIPGSERVLMVGMGLHILWDGLFERLLKHAKEEGAQVDLCIGNPYNPSVQNRLIEEMMWGREPAVGQLGLEQLFKGWVERIEELGPNRSMRLRLAESYPTGTTIVVDDRVFHYRYPFFELGTSSPVAPMMDDGRPDVRFHVENAELIFEHSVPAEEVFRAFRPGYVGRDWIPAAIYMVPESAEPLYRLGSAVLGYDIRAERLVHRAPVPRMKRFVGEALFYGFHSTLGDALYFATPAALERAKAELRFLTKRFPTFELTDIELVYPWNDDPAIVALRCSERSGVVEALHHEILARVYPLGISTLYRARTTTKATPADPRSGFMRGTYGSSFILSEFKPHFTLLSSYNPALDKKSAVLNGLRGAMTELSGTTIRISELNFVVKRPGEKRWTLDPSKFYLQNEGSVFKAFSRPRQPPATTGRDPVIPWPRTKRAPKRRRRDNPEVQP
jgi:hypothetical protein